MDFVDRLLICADCRQQFTFTAGEQLFFFDKQFKNDPKRCKQCKARRATGVSFAPGVALPAGLSRTETRTTCSECGIETTVPFKPTQGRPVLCRQCFQIKRVPAPVAAVALDETPQLVAVSPIEQATAELVAAASTLERSPTTEAIAAAIQLPQA